MEKMYEITEAALEGHARIALVVNVLNTELGMSKVEIDQALKKAYRVQRQEDHQKADQLLCYMLIESNMHRVVENYNYTWFLGLGHSIFGMVKERTGELTYHKFHEEEFEEFVDQLKHFFEVHIPSRSHFLEQQMVTQDVDSAMGEIITQAFERSPIFDTRTLEDDLKDIILQMPRESKEDYVDRAESTDVDDEITAELLKEFYNVI
jgi:hypothetical protein